MKNFLNIMILGFVLLISNFTFGSTIYYPYTLRLDNGIKVKSIAYRIYDNSNPGMTWIYKNNKLLYSIDKRLNGYLVTNESGDILVEINFSLYEKMHRRSEVNEQGETIYLGRLEGPAIKIYKSGIHIKTFDFKDLKINAENISVNFGHFNWRIKDKEIQTPAIIQNNTLLIAAIDSSEIIIPLTNFTNINKKKLTPEKHNFYSGLKVKRKYILKKQGLPDKFLLPLLNNKKTIEAELSNYLGYVPTGSERDSAKLQIYIHTLLIDKKGKCVLCYVTVNLRETTSVDFGNERDKGLENKIEDWLKNQAYQTKLIPRWTDKYGFIDFIYLKE